MLLLTLSIIAILIGPLVLSIFPTNRRLDNFLFSFVLISVGGILVLDLLPQLWQQMGVVLLPVLALGFFGPGLIEMSFKKAADKAHKAALALGIIGLLLHSTMDGMALTDQQGEMLAYAVILHRLIVGLSIWWLVEPIWGRLKSYMIFSILIGVTIIGYYFGNELFALSSNGSVDTWLNYFQAIIAGTLLHVIIHRPHIDDDGHHHDHAHAIENDPHHNHSHGIVIKHMGYFSFGAILATSLLILLHTLH